MKTGKISESILKRSVIKQLHNKNENVIQASMVGGDYASLHAPQGEHIVFATNPVTWEISNNHTYASFAVYAALNNVAVSGAEPIGIMVNVLLPTAANEAQLRELVKEMDQICADAGVQIMGGHTQVTRAVRRIVVTVTGVGMKHGAPFSSRNVEPGMDLIVTKWIGLLGTALLAQEKEQELRQRYAQPFLDKAKTYSEYISILSEAAVASQSDVCAMHDLSEGGIFGALWEMAEAAGVGLDIDLKKIPIRQETVEICEFFDVNPYKLLSQGSLLLAAKDGNRIVREMELAGIPAIVIGKTTDSNDRVLCQMEERRFLETAQTDELYKILKGE